MCCRTFRLISSNFGDVVQILEICTMPFRGKDMAKRSIIDGAIEYMPRKTMDGNPVVVRVPLLTATKEILDKYKNLPGDAILPLVSQQKYNIAIKKILKHAGNMYKNVKDPNLVGALSGHKEGSRAFARYRVTDDVAEANAKEIDEDIKRDLVSMLE